MNSVNVTIWYDRFKYHIDLKYLILLALAGLHYHKKITDKKLKGQFQSLRNGTLQEPKNTYHCGINDRWYHNDSAYDIFKECLEEFRILMVPYKEFIKYIQLFENKNYNYALNIFGHEYIYKFLNYWDPENTECFSDFIYFYIPNIRAKEHSSYCYECGSSHTHYEKDMHNTEALNKWIHSQKKGNLKKIPFFDVSDPKGIKDLKDERFIPTKKC